ncbi:META domain-containing protein [Gallaecimonas sp. GXIMD4217]|uniref:META domain-containing protein n=1 Tax=Gallaecimonas sp. GXIMD4217 TaxID=3131927 RepID=UPI00311AEA3D
MKAQGLAALAVLALMGCQQSAQAPDFFDKTWYLDSREAGDLLAGASAPGGITLTLQADGRLAGRSGCNNYFAGYQLGEDNSLAVSQIGSTRKACMGPIMSAEYRYLERLNKAEKVETRGDSLMLYSQGQSEPLLFRLSR